MKKKVYILGAGGHTRSLINILELRGFRIAGIYDDKFGKSEEINKYKIIGSPEDIKEKGLLILSIGDNGKREELFHLYYKQIYKGNIFHPSAIIEKHIKMEDGNQIFSGVYINSNAKIGSNNILNTKSIIEHEVIIGDHNHISVGAILCGRVQIGNRCFIGAGAVIIDKVKICDDVIVGANSVVLKNINQSGVYVGNPARKI